MELLEKKGVRAWPCNDVLHKWDDNGILIENPEKNNKKINKNCDFNYNTSYQGEPLDTQKHPSTFENPSRDVIIAQNLF